MARWLVTGGAGFIGSHIAERLVRDGEVVRILDNFSTGKQENIRHLRGRATVVRGDIRESSDVRRALKGIDYVLHQAALRSVPRSLEDPLATNDVNVGGTLLLLWESLRARVKKFVYASSSSVYGNSRKFPQSPDQNPLPISPYAVSKLTGEYYCRVFSETFDLPTVSLRYFNVFGPRQDPFSKYAVVIPIFIRAALERTPLPLHGNGSQSRDFAYIDNVVDANLLAAKRKTVGGAVYNVACGQNHSLNDYIRLLEMLTHRRLAVQKLPFRSGDVPKTYADISATRRDLRYRPSVLFAEGVRRTFRHFLNAPSGRRLARPSK